MLANRDLMSQRALQWQFANMKAARQLLTEVAGYSKRAETIQNAEREIAAIDSRLGAAEFATVAVEWAKHKKSPGKTPEWYSLFKGPRNLKDLATEIKSDDQYWHYKRLSKSAHAIDVCDAFTQTGSHFEFGPILGEIETIRVLSLGMGLALQFIADYATAIDPAAHSRLAQCYLRYRAQYLMIAEMSDLD